MAAQIRKVIYSQTRGVFLSIGGAGVPRWSKDNGVLPTDRAPTFVNQQEVDLLLDQFDLRKDWPTDAGLYEVWPTGPGFTATANNAADGGLPRWDSPIRMDGGGRSA